MEYKLASIKFFAWSFLASVWIISIYDVIRFKNWWGIAVMLIGLAVSFIVLKIRDRKHA